MRVRNQDDVDRWVTEAKARALALDPDELSRTLFEFTHVFHVSHRRATALSDELRGLGYETTHSHSFLTTTVFAATRGVMEWQRIERSGQLFERLIESAHHHRASYRGWHSHRITTFGT